MASLPFSVYCCLFSYSCFLGMAQANAKKTTFSAYISIVFLVWVFGRVVMFTCSHHGFTSCSQSHHGFTLCKYQIYISNSSIHVQHLFLHTTRKKKCSSVAKPGSCLISKLPIFWISWHTMDHNSTKVKHISGIERGISYH